MSFKIEKQPFIAQAILQRSIAALGKPERSRVFLQVGSNSNKYFSFLVQRGNILFDHWFSGSRFIHDIRNPIAGVLACSQILLDEFDEGDERKALIGEMISQLVKLDGIISNYSLTLKSLEPCLTPSSLGELLDSLIPEIENSLEVKIEEDLANTRDICLIDEVATATAIYNLINVQCHINNFIELSVSTWEDSRSSTICLDSMPRRSSSTTEQGISGIEITDDLKYRLELAIELFKRQEVKVQWRKDDENLLGFTAFFPSAERK